MGVRNKLADLNDHLFAQMERLGEEELSDEAMDREIERAKAVTNVAQQIIVNGNLVLKAEIYKQDYMDSGNMPKFLEGGD